MSTSSTKLNIVDGLENRSPLYPSFFTQLATPVRIEFESTWLPSLVECYSRGLRQLIQLPSLEALAR